MVEGAKPNKDTLLRRKGIRTQMTSMRAKLLRGEKLSDFDTDLFKSEERNPKLAGEIRDLKKVADRAQPGQPFSKADADYLRTGKKPITVTLKSAVAPPVIRLSQGDEDTLHEMLEAPSQGEREDVIAAGVPSSPIFLSALRAERDERSHRTVDIKLLAGLKQVELEDIVPAIPVNYAVDMARRLEESFGHQDYIPGLIGNATEPVNETIARKFVLCRFPRGPVIFRNDIVKFFQDNPDLEPANIRELVEFYRSFEFPEPTQTSIVAFGFDPKEPRKGTGALPTIYYGSHADGRYYAEFSQSPYHQLHEEMYDLHILAYKKETPEHVARRVHMSEVAMRTVEINFYSDPSTFELFEVKPAVKVEYGQDLKLLDDRLLRFETWHEKEDAVYREKTGEREFVLCRLRGSPSRDEVLEFFKQNPDIVPANHQDLFAFNQAFEYPSSKSMSVNAVAAVMDTDGGTMIPSVFSEIGPEDDQHVELGESAMPFMTGGDTDTFILAYKK